MKNIKISTAQKLEIQNFIGHSLIPESRFGTSPRIQPPSAVKHLYLLTHRFAPYSPRHESRTRPRRSVPTTGSTSACSVRSAIAWTLRSAPARHHRISQKIICKYSTTWRHRMWIAVVGWSTRLLGTWVAGDWSRPQCRTLHLKNRTQNQESQKKKLISWRISIFLTEVAIKYSLKIKYFLTLFCNFHWRVQLCKWNNGKPGINLILRKNLISVIEQGNNPLNLILLSTLQLSIFTFLIFFELYTLRTFHFFNFTLPFPIAVSGFLIQNFNEKWKY